MRVHNDHCWANQLYMRTSTVFVVAREDLKCINCLRNRCSAQCGCAGDVADGLSPFDVQKANATALNPQSTWPRKTYPGHHGTVPSRFGHELQPHFATALKSALETLEEAFLTITTTLLVA